MNKKFYLTRAGVTTSNFMIGGSFKGNTDRIKMEVHYWSGGTAKWTVRSILENHLFVIKK